MAKMIKRVVMVKISVIHDGKDFQIDQQSKNTENCLEAQVEWFEEIEWAHVVLSW